MTAEIVVRSRIRVNARAAEAWTIVADYRHDAAWRGGVLAMGQDTPGLVVVGTQTIEDFRMLGQRMTNAGVVDRVDEGREFHWRTTSGSNADGTRSVIPVGESACDIQLEIASRPSGFIENLLRPLIGRTLQRSLDESLERLKSLIEERVPAR